MREMKDSGISWVGEIPKEWTIMPLYCFYSERKNKNIFGAENNLLSLSYGKVIRKDINTSEGLLPSNYNGYNIVEAGDIIIRPTDLQNDKRSLRTGLSKERGIITSAYIALKPKNGINSRFYHYLLHTYDILKVFYNMGNGVRQGLNYDEFAKLMVYSPSDTEQQRIAEFLDKACGKIDGLKADIQAQIDTLEQYKRSIITEAVTHGLNPSAPMKDSGIPWVGKTPQNRVKAKIKNVASMISSGTTPLSAVSEFFEDGTINWIQSGDIYRKKYINDVSMKITELALASSSSLKIVRKPFIVMAMYGGSVGNTAISLIDACTNQACCCIKPNDKTNFGFLYYWLLFCREDFLIKAEGGGQPNISQNKIRNEYIFIPPLDEQQEIADYLDNKCAEIEQIIADKKTQIETLDGYKKSLIYEYVTGKKEVV